MDALRVLIFWTLAIWLACGSAHAEKRVALVIGNSEYKNARGLPNPANDATDFGSMLKNAGFDLVITQLNGHIAEMRTALREFGAQTRDSDVAVMFYSGYGIDLDGENYLIPIDAKLETDADIVDEAISLDGVLLAVESAKQLRLVILDACRDNPFAKTMKKTLASRAIGRGLAKVEPNGPNTLIAYSAKAGSTALDGNGRNSPFTIALLKHLTTPGLDVRRAFGFVRDDVLKSTGNREEPFVYGSVHGSLGGDDVPLVPAKPTATPSEDAIRKDFELAMQSGDREK
jgi:uncharacterized caspase-like protein